MPSITQPLLGWSNESPATFGTVARIDMDGTLNVSMLIFCITLRSLFVFLHVCV